MSKARDLADLLDANGDVELDALDNAPSGSGKNLIINGAMQVAQRGTSFTKSGSSNVYILDRFNQVSNASAATVVYSQDPEAPANFKNSLKFSVTTADTDLTSQRCLISQFIEGQNVAHLNWGTADAQDVTLSFWVRSSLTGTFGGSFINSAEDYSYPFTYTISSADTWEYKTVTVTGPTAGTWLDTNGVGIRIHWSMGTGSYRLGTAGSWSANRYEGATGQVDPVSTTSATWYITGVQLEVGSVATPFEHRSYGEELQLCKRYYQTSGSGAMGSQVCLCGRGNGTASSVAFLPLPVQMRSSPTSNTNIASTEMFSIAGYGSGTATVSAYAGTNRGMGTALLIGGLSGGTDNRPNYVAFSSELTFEAEL